MEVVVNCSDQVLVGCQDVGEPWPPYPNHYWLREHDIYLYLQFPSDPNKQLIINYVHQTKILYKEIN